MTRGYKNNNKFMCIRLRYEFEGKQKVLQKIIRKSKRNEIIIVTFSRIVENGKDLLKIVATNQQHIELENHVFSLFRFC